MLLSRATGSVDRGAGPRVAVPTDPAVRMDSDLPGHPPAKMNSIHQRHHQLSSRLETKWRLFCMQQYRRLSLWIAIILLLLPVFGGLLFLFGANARLGSSVITRATTKPGQWFSLNGEAAENILSIQCIYYINLAKNTKRRSHMEGLLGGRSIPYERVNALVGGSNARCVPEKSHPEQCRGLTGLLLTNIHIIDNLNTSGVTLVLEDDFNFNSLSLLEQSLKLVPPDWDVVRFQCLFSDNLPSTFRHVSDSVFQTVHTKPCNSTQEQCWFCGGTVNMFWRGSSVHKLRTLWAEEPYDDIDCRLTTDRVKSYCIDLGLTIEQMHMPPEAEISDIPKIGD